MAKYGMSIDLDKCVGCGACALACKTENNTTFLENSKRFNWADYLTSTSGTFIGGDVSFKVIPTLCNHCSDAPCVAACPVTPKAMFKTDTGITMHNDARCIGCRACQSACPYSEFDLDGSNSQYSVISFNPDIDPTHPFYADETAIIQGGTSTPKEIATATAMIPPHKHDYTHPDYNAVRPGNVVEKCIFCDHRVQISEQPYCVVSCPTGSRIFGDLDDPASDVSVAIANGAARLKDNSGEYLASGEAGTNPNVFYLGQGVPTGIRGRKIETPAELLSIYPNPTKSSATLEFELMQPENVTIELFDITGKLVKTVMKNQARLTGRNRINLSVTELGSGIYIARLSYGKNKSTVNLVISK